MAYAKARRHYRVAQKEIQRTQMNGVFIPEDKRMRIILIATAIVLCVFLKGLIIGYLTGRNRG